ncbi:hypothetical protein WJX84_005019 [Apatococcus fuscideae]|uniref:histone acetyltransferase n=1 Tax=Apatococcus fuscideae TaxID=2026836 RepID=A0AAW1T3C5_9CHLO
MDITFWSVAQAGTLGATRTVAGGDCAGQRHGKSQASCKMDISFRPLAEWDRAELVALHVALFPINYEDGFYNSALGNEGGFFTLAAIQRHSNGQEKMAALNFYLRNGFAQAALLRDFYFIRSDRQPEPGREIYDAYLYVLLLEPAAVSHITPWALMQAAAGPFRDAWYHFTSYLQPVLLFVKGRISFYSPVKSIVKAGQCHLREGL